ncbi:MAG: alanine--tRNA ligase, partial [Janthinobacterium lividum]
MLTASQIRQQFLDFFASKQHQIVPSAPIVIKNDPQLMFTNAGMNQFKGIFLGEEAAKFSRVTDTQRCLRVAGKHDDLEEVGIDTYHHTMFEMLGNWSFGDYFKKEAINWSWELLTEVYKIDKDRLYVTYFEGDEKEGLEKDQEAYDLWKQFLPESHILPGNKKDNFWEMGETGPCGPCSEIHFDNRSEEERSARSGAELVNADDPQVIEIWNNVFMQFQRVWGGLNGGFTEYTSDAQVLKDAEKEKFDIKAWKSSNLYLYTKLQPLPNKHVDTGMGFERLVRVLQGKSSNYDTDIFQPLIQFIAVKSGKTYMGNAVPNEEGWNEAVAMRVMADHIRAIAFAIADGQLPSNNKAGYVIRRILRRAVRYAYQYLNFKEPFLNQLVLLLAEQFKDVFPNLYGQKDFVQKVVFEEEVSFLRTLERGIKAFEDYIIFIVDEEERVRIKNKHSIKNSSNKSFSEIYDEMNAIMEIKTTIPSKVISGNFAFQQFDSNGFPIDLTELMARERGLSVDMERFEKLLQEQKNRSRAATAIDTGDWSILKEDDTVAFTGYTETETIAHIIKYRKVKAKGKEQFQLVLDKTPFYAESGGQVGDTGDLIFPDGEIIPVTDTKKENGLIVHFVDKLPEDPTDV